MGAIRDFIEEYNKVHEIKNQDYDIIDILETECALLNITTKIPSPMQGRHLDFYHYNKGLMAYMVFNFLSTTLSLTLYSKIHPYTNYKTQEFSSVEETLQRVRNHLIELG